MIEINLNFTEEEVLVFFSKKGIKTFTRSVPQKDTHHHGSHFTENKPIEEWVVIYEKRIQPMKKVFNKMIRQNLLR